MTCLVSRCHSQRFSASSKRSQILNGKTSSRALFKRYGCVEAHSNQTGHGLQLLYKQIISR